MTPYNDSILRRYVLLNKELAQKFAEFLSEGGDRFGETAMKKVYCQCILTDRDHLAAYEEEYRLAHLTPDRQYVEQLEEIMYKIGWKRFLVALIFLLKRLKKKQKYCSQNERRVEISLECLEKVPKTIEL